MTGCMDVPCTKEIAGNEALNLGLMSYLIQLLDH